MLKQKYSTSFHKASELMIRINESHRTLQTLHKFYTEDIWEYFKSIGTDNTSHVTDCFNQFVDGIQGDAIYELKKIFDWIADMEKQLEQLAGEHRLPDRIVPEEKYCIIAPNCERFEFVLCSNCDNNAQGDEAVVKKIEAIASSWEVVATNHRKIAAMLKHRLIGLIDA